MKTKIVSNVSEGAMQAQDRIRQRIVEAARDKFFRFGFSRVTMDEISAECRVSKKTLYKHFLGKEILLRAVIRMVMAEVGGGVDQIVGDQSLDFVERVKRLMIFLGMRMSQFSRPFAQDIRMYAPEIWKEVQEFRRIRIVQNFGKILREGMDKGILRRDADPELLMLMFLAVVENLINPEVLAEAAFTPFEVFQTLGRVMFEGIMTDKARRKNFGGIISLKKRAGGKI